MILVDTSVWIDHFRIKADHLVDLATRDELCMHAFVVVELASGHLANRTSTLAYLKAVPHILPAGDEEVLTLIETQKLMGRGLGYVDLHLLASAKLNSVRIWTRDRRMLQAAVDLEIAHTPESGSGFSS
jgi:predicted nucleic acid-binding protein